MHSSCTYIFPRNLSISTIASYSGSVITVPSVGFLGAAECEVGIDPGGCAALEHAKLFD